MATPTVPTCLGVAGAHAEWHIVCHQTKLLPGELSIPSMGRAAAISCCIIFIYPQVPIFSKFIRTPLYLRYLGQN